MKHSSQDEQMLEYLFMVFLFLIFARILYKFFT